jgi:hypothetical protein
VLITTMPARCHRVQQHSTDVQVLTYHKACHAEAFQVRLFCRGADSFGDARWHAPDGDASPELLESGEVEWGAMPNLDLFFERVYG